MKTIAMITGLLLSTFTYGQVLTKNMLLNIVTTRFPEILAQKEKVVIAHAKQLEAQGGFDPYLSGNIASAPKSGYENNYLDTTLYLPIENTPLTIYGGYRIGRGQWPVYYQNYLTNGYGETKLGMRYPLLRDQSIDSNRANIAKKRVTVLKQEAIYQLKKTEIIAKAIDVYYQWIASHMRLAIAKKQLKIALERQHAIEKQVTLGDTGKITLTENSRLIMQRKSVLLEESLKLKLSQQKLSFYLGYAQRYQPPRLSRLLSKISFRPKLFKMLLQKQPLNKQIAFDVRTVSIDLKLADNQFLPNLDLDVFVKRGFGEGSTNLEKTSINLGLSYKLPFLQRKAKGKLAAAKATLKNLEYYRIYYRRFFHLTLNNALAELNTSVRTYQYQLKEQRYAKALEQAERQKFQAGDSSLFLVNQREQTVNKTQLETVKDLITFYRKRNLLESFCLYQKSCLQKLH